MCILIMQKIQAKEIIGGDLSITNKMPCKSFNLPAWECKTGSKLSKVKGSSCYNCYAKKGNYVRYPAVKKAQYKRLSQIMNPAWVDAMVDLIEREVKRINESIFRWHDAGDIQHIPHLKNIVAVANKTPDVKHWIPTQENKIVNDFIKAGGIIPDNLIVRVSASMVNGKPPKNAKYTSTVHTTKPIGHECPASNQGGQCLSCRACWNTSIKNVSYKQH